MKTVTVTEVARNFSDFVNRVAYRDECFVLSRGGKPLAELRPLPAGCRLGELPERLRALPRLGEAAAAEWERELDSRRASLNREAPRDPWAS